MIDGNADFNGAVGRLLGLSETMMTLNDVASALVGYRIDLDEGIPVFRDALVELLVRGDADAYHKGSDEFIEMVRNVEPDTGETMILPADVNGDPIHIGYVMESNISSNRVRVIGVSKRNFFWGNTFGPQIEYARDWHIYQPTVESLLEEMMKRYADKEVSADTIGVYAEEVRKVAQP